MGLLIYQNIVILIFNVAMIGCYLNGKDLKNIEYHVTHFHIIKRCAGIIIQQSCNILIASDGTPPS